ncbi:MAG: hypothetical protein OIF50_04430 [Flavobacteriaceae bacterium]|nr:hypothetical protein [Flavobacteriaceae bacterium]
MKQNIPTSKKKLKLIMETFIAFFLVMTPFLFYSHEYINEETTVLFGIDSEALNFPSMKVFLWYVLSKLIPIVMLSIWFFTCKHWWYHVLIIPISMYTFQLLTLFLDIQTNELDKEEIIWILPVCIVVIPFVYLIRVKLYDKHVLGIDLDQIEADIKEMEARKEERENKMKDLDIPESTSNK